MTLTEPDMKRRSSAPYFNTNEVLEMTGLSYRVLDYWLRTGAINLADGSTRPGSGVSRRYSEDEVEAILLLVSRYQQANDEIEAIRSGKMWAELLAEQEVA
jgi:DNA-binding transcriptional MerR regulator